jgi:GrpB-like predicted nucleotidyltransferase (UPF0157 family)
MKSEKICVKSGTKNTKLILELVELCTYSPNWSHVFSQEEKQLVNTIKKENLLAIEHFGSTSITGMIAKPIIDIIVGLKDFKLESEELRKLSELGYNFIEESSYCQRFYFHKRSSYAINLSITEYGNSTWINCLSLRDYLRDHPDEKNRYINKKLEALYTGNLTIEKYSSYKSNFVQ